jgi:hypothetical protein
MWVDDARYPWVPSIHYRLSQGRLSWPSTRRGCAVRACHRSDCAQQAFAGIMKEYSTYLCTVRYIPTYTPLLLCYLPSEQEEPNNNSVPSTHSMGPLLPAGCGILPLPRHDGIQSFKVPYRAETQRRGSWARRRQPGKVNRVPDVVALTSPIAPMTTETAKRGRHGLSGTCHRMVHSTIDAKITSLCRGRK